MRFALSTLGCGVFLYAWAGACWLVTEAYWRGLLWLIDLKESLDVERA